jgi:predicted outer membrane repeat protein
MSWPAGPVRDQVRRFGVAAGALLLPALIGAPPVAAAPVTLYVALTPTVTSPGGGSCASPDYNTIQAAVTAAASGDTVHICAGTYALTGTVTFYKTLTFVGDGAATTIIDGGGTVQLFVGPSQSAAFEDLTFKNGQTHLTPSGGAIDAYRGSVTVTNSTFSGNSAYLRGGAIEAGSVTVTNSTFSGNTAPGDHGGAIFSYGSVTVTNSTFSGNAAAEGGAIDAYGSVTVTNSTFSGNSVYLWGGAIEAGGVTVTNSTFSGNSAPTGGAIMANGGATLTGTILAQPSATDNCAGTVVDGGGNFSTDASCGFTQSTSHTSVLSHKCMP